MTLTAAVPSYLKNYEELYRENPRAANMQWFRDAKYGLFLHYGLFSVYEEGDPKKVHEWIQLWRKIPVAEYEKRAERFTAEHFDADHIAAFAVDCGMKYINLITRHHDSFCLWDSKETEFHSVNSPAKRNLVAELAQACEKHGLGLFLYYSHGRDWRHPHAPNNDEWGGSARPQYDPPEPSYKYGREHNLDIYLEFMKKQITELLTLVPQAAGIWLDGIAVPKSGDISRFKCQELYDLIRSLSPHALISYKQGLLGTEDFFAPEHKIPDGTGGKLIEICTTMIKDPVSWGYTPDAQHLSTEEVWEKLKFAQQYHTNLLLNTGPLPDGSIDPVDERILREIGARLRKEGFPE